MYGSVTYEDILKKMLDRVPAEIDKREGSIVYTALAPAAAELEIMCIQADWILDQMFSDTAVREYLTKRCSEWGIVPYPPTKAQRKGEFNMDVALGSRFSLGTQNYAAVEKIADGVYRMECETAGSEGNKNHGTMVPVSYIAGLTKAELTAVLVEGMDEEDTEALRERFLAKVQKPSTSGNKYDYYNWAMECAGVGAAKVFPLADGPGTVKVVIADRTMKAASRELIRLVEEHTEELRPVGADVTIASGMERAVNVSAKVRISNGANLGTIQNEFYEQLKRYLRSSAFDLSYISQARIGSLLLGTPGIADYDGLQINGSEENIKLGPEEIAVAGDVTLEVLV